MKMESLLFLVLETVPGQHDLVLMRCYDSSSGACFRHTSPLSNCLRSFLKLPSLTASK